MRTSAATVHSDAIEGRFGRAIRRLDQSQRRQALRMLHELAQESAKQRPTSEGLSDNAECATVERLIADWQAAINHHDELFDANDRDGSVSDAAVYEALSVADNVLEALCRYRPTNPVARLRRSDFLAEELTRSTYGSEALMFRMFRALTV